MDVETCRSTAYSTGPVRNREKWIEFLTSTHFVEGVITASKICKWGYGSSHVLSTTDGLTLQHASVLI